MVFIAISVVEFVCAIRTSWMIYSITMFLKFNMIVFELVVHGCAAMFKLHCYKYDGKDWTTCIHVKFI